MALNALDFMFFMANAEVVVFGDRDHKVVAVDVAGKDFDKWRVKLQAVIDGLVAYKSLPVIELHPFYWYLCTRKES
jgi:hypothetical protein